MMQHSGDWACGPLMKPLHLQFYDLGVGSDFPEKITSGAQLVF